MADKPITGQTQWGGATSGSTSDLDANFTRVNTVVNSWNTYANYVADTGAANAYVVTCPANITATLAAGLRVQFKATNANTGASTLNVNATGVKNILNIDGSTLSSGQIPLNGIVDVIYDGTQYLLLATPPNGQFRSMQVYTATGANTWTKPAGLKRIKVTVVGGGGGGGGSIATGAAEWSVGAGGGGGGCSIKVIEAASLGATETATVGAKGTGTNGGAGTGGGTSSFGTHCSATGGNGGGAATNASQTGSAGAMGGIGSSGTINFAGGAGTAATATNGAGNGINMSGTGGGSFFGGGGRGIAQGTGAGTAAQNYGGGGGGALASPGQAAQTGGDGTAGIIIVEEFF